jgi:hypothetical protein
MRQQAHSQLTVFALALSGYNRAIIRTIHTRWNDDARRRPHRPLLHPADHCPAPLAQGKHAPRPSLERLTVPFRIPGVSAHQPELDCKVLTHA